MTLGFRRRGPYKRLSFAIMQLSYLTMASQIRKRLDSMVRTEYERQKQNPNSAN